MASQKKLTARQESFISEYLIHFEAKKAAIKAGYSPKTAESQSSQLLKNPKVKKEIERRQAQTGKRNADLRDRVIQRLCTIAFSNLSDYGEINPEEGLILHEAGTVPKEKLAAISEFYINKTVKKVMSDKKSKTKTQVMDVKMKFKLKSSERALELLARHLGLLNDTLPDEVQPFIIKTSKGNYHLGVKSSE